MDYSIIGKAGISVQEAASVVGVSRVMMWRWTTGDAEPRVVWQGKPLRKRVEMFLSILERLVQKGSLPKPNLALSTRMPQEVREKRALMVTKLRQLLDERVAP